MGKSGGDAALALARNRRPQFVFHANFDAPVRRREFAGVLQEVPKDLGDARAVGEDVGFGSLDVEGYRDVFLGRGGRAIVADGMLEERANIDDLPAKLQLAMDDAIDVEQVIDRSGLGSFGYSQY